MAAAVASATNDVGCSWQRKRGQQETGKGLRWSMVSWLQAVVCWVGVKFKHRAEVRTTQWELVENSSEVIRGSNDVVRSSPRTHQRFVGSLPTCCPKLSGSSPEKCWEFIRSSLEEIGSSSRVH
ncbi:hypothetical protein GW17_00035085 [Ensete ventricosum]|nr:hypothetical protein GW17_00035085 [Ensete ventricosum]